MSEKWKKMEKEKLNIFINELLKWNKVHKLTNYKTKEMLFEQIEDSLYPIEWVEGKNAIDIGTGAGFPGMILAIAKPEMKWYLVEPLKKRYSFLNYIKMILDLKNVKVVPKRLENSNIEKVDLITSRAVTKTDEILNIAKPFLKKDGKILLYKGSSVLEELGVKAQIKTRGNRNYVLIKNGDNEWEK